MSYLKKNVLETSSEISASYLLLHPSYLRKCVHICPRIQDTYLVFYCHQMLYCVIVVGLVDLLTPYFDTKERSHKGK